MKKRFRKVRLTREGKMITAGAAAVLVLLVLLSFFFFFRVDQVYVVGNTRYTDDEVKEYVMTTPLTSNTVLAMLFQKHKNADNIPFVDSFDLERVNAHTLRIHVNEKKIVGYITQGTDKLYFNKDGMVVEVTAMEQEEIDGADQEEEELNQLKEQAAQEEAAQAAQEAKEALTGETDEADTSEDTQADGNQAEDTSQENSGEEQVLQAVESDSTNENATKFKAAVTDVPRIIGITTKEGGIGMGDTIPAVADGIYNTILGITRMVEKYEILPEMVCFDENQEIILVYNNGNIHCNLGKDALLEEKITRVAAILPKLKDFTGILHLEDYDTDITNIIFSKETLYTLKMQIAQIEGKDFSEDASANTISDNGTETKDNTENSTDGNTEDNTGDSTEGNTEDNTEDSTEGNTEDNTVGNTDGNAEDNTVGDSTGEAASQDNM